MVWSSTVATVRTSSVGSKPAGASWVGALDMSGNVSEWVSSLYAAYPYNASDGREADGNSDSSSSRVLRGGSWVSNAIILRAANRTSFNPAITASFIGFRCARSFSPAVADAPLDVPTPTAEPPMEQSLPPRELAENGVSSNDEWTPYTEEFNGVEMALVPAGCYMMGSENGYENETPVHEQCFDKPFWIDVYEVTNAQYGSGSVFGDNRPHVQVSWFDAVAHCESRGTRLPTEAEWEYAARGPDNLTYPWGDEFVADYVVYGDNSGGQTGNVGSRPGGASWVGALDMSGNVWDWVSSIDGGYPYRASDGREADGNTDSSSSRVLRGGSWGDNAFNLRAANRYWYDSDFADGVTGFRCARSF